MNATLISAIVRQTTVLIASLATASGQRAQLAALANQVFADLVRELREQGLGNKVIADMFGLALRTYHRKLARLTASQSDQGRSLWEAVFAHIQQHGPLLRADLLRRFARDDEVTLHSVVLDLVESGLIQRDGEGDAVSFKAVQADAAANGGGGGAQLDAMLRVALHRAGPTSLDGLAQLVPAAREELEAALTRLTADGSVSARNGLFSCETYLLGFGEPKAWEGAVFDHYQAMVVALVSKLRAGARRADLADSTGGSTFVFDLWEGHPMQQEVMGYLRSVRERGIALRKALDAHPEPAPEDKRSLRVTAYVGQSVALEEEENDA
ncbi:MAG TPA: hypothetical protein VJV78_11435 [Polyangiales bacterium]|nr:hypothetical protein [Polyangiales bacterium]